jgi:hypothetical protein
MAACVVRARRRQAAFVRCSHDRSRLWQLSEPHPTCIIRGLLGLACRFYVRPLDPQEHRDAVPVDSGVTLRANTP